DVHGGAVGLVTGIAEFVGQFLASGQRGVDVERLEQIDDRGLPVELLARSGNGCIENGGDVDFSGGSGRRRGLAGGGVPRDSVGDYLVGCCHAHLDGGLLLGSKRGRLGSGRRRGRGGRCRRCRDGRRGGSTENLGLDIVQEAHGYSFC